MRLDLSKGTKDQQAAAIKLEGYKDELERVDNKYDEMNKKYQRMVAK